jgi:hypothetical protein
MPKNNYIEICLSWNNNEIHSGYLLAVDEIKFIAHRVEEIPASRTKTLKVI